MRIQHVGLIVSDLDRSRRFYARALGLEEVPRPSNFTFDGAWFRFGGTEIHLLAEAHTTGGAGHGSRPGRRPGLDHHVAFEVDDLEADCARLADNGVPLAGGPMPRGDGYVRSSSATRTATCSSSSSGRARTRATRRNACRSRQARERRARDTSRARLRRRAGTSRRASARSASACGCPEARARP